MHTYIQRILVKFLYNLLLYANRVFITTPPQPPKLIPENHSLLGKGDNCFVFSPTKNFFFFYTSVPEGLGELLLPSPPDDDFEGEEIFFVGLVVVAFEDFWDVDGDDSFT